MLSTSAPPELADRLRLAVTRTARRLRQEAESPLSPTLLATLSTIEHRGPVTPSELARIEGVQRPTVTRALGRLVDDGLVERLPDARDARSTLLCVTPEGRARLRTLRRRKAAYLARRLEALSEEERAALSRASDLLERILDEETA